MKYSIVIVAYEAKEKLDRCLESLLAHPPEDASHEAEIIIVDNSPQPVGPDNALLHRLLLAYVRVIIVWDGVNRGFAEGCNEGARQSHGKNVVLVNPDTEVYPEWAERMSSFLKPGVGAVGPISNFVAGLQRVDLHMQPCATHEKTARMARKGNSGRGVDTKMLIGFFLMVPRKVWDEVGGLDPVFFLGCDDLDLSLRLRDAGYSLVIASDVYVYHYGHASFEAAGERSTVLNKQAEKAMLAKLQAKYGDNIPSSTELWGCEILPTVIPKRMTLGVCMIVRNEEQNLRALLPQLVFADEIVVVDTGSEDGTPDLLQGLALGMPIRIHQFTWCDDFAAARNFAKAHCATDYVLWLDADDRITDESAALIRAAFDNPGPKTQAKEVHFALRLRDHLSTGAFGYCDQPRVFPRLPGIEWKGRVHETYLESADKLGLTLVTTGILLDHTGYKDPEVLARKHERNLVLLHQEPDSPLKLYQIGKSRMGLRSFAIARMVFRRLLSEEWGSPLAEDFRQQVRYLIALSYYQEREKADPVMDEWLKDNPKPDAFFLRAERALFDHRIEQAEEMYRAYADYNGIMDYFGTDKETFQACAKMRLETIQKARDAVAV